ncbi:MAG: polysaccharide pyruvyl transferase family protein [Bacteroidales bacterium]|nr:polysaccharide pyruvyl transferase family protein [Bacteroidales bacterium]
MKKIALVTCYFQHNYGSQLQALATQMICDKLGWPNETICIDGLKPEINRAKYRYFLSHCMDIQTILDKMATVRKVYAKKTNKEYATKLRSRDNLFRQFAQEKFRLSPIYNSKAELGKDADKYSAFIVGSDQLWLPSNISADYYTLNFVPNGTGVRKVAYATSFGVAQLPAKQARMAREFLPRFDSIMVREESGKKLVKQLINIDVPVVCDPTFLFQAKEWDTIIPQKCRIKEPYILCYFLGNNPKQRAWAKELAQITHLKIVQLPNLDEYIKSDEGFADYPLYNVDPLDFVSLIRDAQYVLTDSFHCTSLSALYQKTFFCFRRYQKDSAVSTNGRLYSLLSNLNLSDRLLSAKESVKHCLQLQIDYPTVNSRIEQMRQRSIDLLKKSIE